MLPIYGFNYVHEGFLHDRVVSCYVAQSSSYSKGSFVHYLVKWTPGNGRLGDGRLQTAETGNLKLQALE